MKWINHKDVSTTELKSFALTMSWAILSLFTLLLPWIFERNIQFWPLYVSGVLMLLYGLLPKAIYPIYHAWMLIAGVIGWINTRVILALVFYLFIFPIGVLLRIFGKLQYQPSESDSEPSYWKVRDIELKKDDLERPF